jgi:hypothetical protein
MDSCFIIRGIFYHGSKKYKRENQCFISLPSKVRNLPDGNEKAPACIFFNRAIPQLFPIACKPARKKQKGAIFFKTSPCES